MIFDGASNFTTFQVNEHRAIMSDLLDSIAPVGSFASVLADHDENAMDPANLTEAHQQSPRRVKRVKRVKGAIRRKFLAIGQNPYAAVLESYVLRIFLCGRRRNSDSVRYRCAA